MSIKSRIYLSENVPNTKPRGPNADAEYAIAYVCDATGACVPALFTDTELAKAVQRAAKNPEDVPPAYVEPEVEVKVSWWRKLLGFL